MHFELSDDQREFRHFVHDFVAKELRPIAEKAVTQGKRDTLHARRLVNRMLPERQLVKKLFDDIAPRFQDRSGGYTRIIKLGPRRGDGAEMAVIEFVELGAGEAEPDKKKSKTQPPNPTGRGYTSLFEQYHFT